MIFLRAIRVSPCRGAATDTETPQAETDRNESLILATCSFGTCWNLGPRGHLNWVIVQVYYNSCGQLALAPAIPQVVRVSVSGAEDLFDEPTAKQSDPGNLGPQFKGVAEQPSWTQQFPENDFLGSKQQIQYIQLGTDCLHCTKNCASTQRINWKVWHYTQIQHEHPRRMRNEQFPEPIATIVRKRMAIHRDVVVHFT
jgi:hypothetical protein